MNTAVTGGRRISGYALYGLWQNALMMETHRGSTSWRHLDGREKQAWNTLAKQLRRGPKVQP